MKRRKAVGLSLVLVPIVVFAVFRLWAAFAIERAQDRVRDQGYPANMTELDEYYRASMPEENGADLLKLAFDASMPPDQDSEPFLPVSGGGELPPPTEPIPKEMAIAIRCYILLNDNSLKYISEATAFDAQQFPIDFQNYANNTLQHLASMRGLARKTHLAALLGAIDQDSAAAANGVALTLGLAAVLEHEPILISQLVRMALCGHAIAALEETIGRVQYTRSELIALQDQFAEADSGRGMKEALIGERCGFSSGYYAGMRVVQNGIADWSKEDILHDLQQIMGINDLLRLQMYESIERLVEHFEESDDISLDVIQDPEMAAGLPQSVVRSLEANLRNSAQMRTAIVAVAAERYHREHGQYPEAANVLVPEYLESIPADPFDGAPIRYRRFENGFVVYSISLNLEDQNGEESERGDSWREGDLAFTVLHAK